ncbi:MAG TPA: hypothetical protein VLE99_02130 [Candidatus Saccharimonadales bacterium]|nr:hypothetical protein [Candidatus Saccharimonadales bacterium]
MLDDLTIALTEYNRKWQKLVSERQNKALFEGLKPIAVGWKTKDRAEYDKLVAELHDQSDQIIETWMNGRWVAKLHLKETQLWGGIALVKIMQRRPSSTDAIGLDHVDFYGPALAETETVLKQEPGLKWTRESNDIIAGYDWLSVWFDDTEAKLKPDTVLDIIQAELKELNRKLTS